MDPGLLLRHETSESELLSRLDPATVANLDDAKLLREFAKMIYFREDETGEVFLELQSLDHQKEREKIEKWRTAAEDVAATIAPTKMPRDDPKSLESTARKQGQLKDELENFNNLLQQKKAHESEALEATIQVGGKFRSDFNVKIWRSGQRVLLEAAKVKSSTGHRPLRYSCSLQHATMLLPPHLQLFENDEELFEACLQCVHIRPGRSISLRRRTKSRKSKWISWLGKIPLLMCKKWRNSVLRIGVDQMEQPIIPT